jgi:hypothetical protein
MLRCPRDLTSQFCVHNSIAKTNTRAINHQGALGSQSSFDLSTLVRQASPTPLASFRYGSETDNAYAMTVCVFNNCA